MAEVLQKILRRILPLFLLCFLIIVSFLVEHREEDEILETRSLILCSCIFCILSLISNTCKHKGRRSRKVAFKEKRLNGMEEYQDKLDKLDCCDVFLPPEILLNFRAKCSTQIVEVHNSVHP